ncbi:hypothetical protein [Corynebacterium macginleyi]|uniref:hypothetical protein n=1 Tax=Corynebacterium macginleyi TaxID=38290 RepID=UPI0019092FA4|nr:hypothetical protein [Corynebacterium macginleyi]MBK4137527.1 hypothetical protein [Corynebacterium macginleyi]MBK4142720.1 hypothetical protein [Corynebacterium macginleyi]MBK4149055.1 hypothetical protein [Corynebacterium macginleyi]MBK4158648.1 hypothetical protein [Corynebacterium macginleyi]MBK4178619.1 hypothetical protein [Corynebacterium macginleyi]
MKLHRLLAASATATLLATTPLTSQATELTPKSDQESFSTQEGHSTYNISRVDENKLRLEVQNATISQNGDFIDITSKDGKGLERLSGKIIYDDGREINLSYTIESPTSILIDAEKGGIAPRSYRSCVGKNAAGGVMGGAAAGCAAGFWFAGVGSVAGVGPTAVTGGIATGVGSLIWCA